MGPGIGETLREARIRRRIDLADVEAATKIRVRYLRALENDEWDVLPGDAYARSFIRTYANHLGLDGERLADEFRRQVGDPIREGYPRADTAPAAQRPPGRRPGEAGPRLQVSRGALAALISIGLIVLLVGIGLAGSDGGDDDGPQPAVGKRDRSKGENGGQGRAEASPGQVSVRLRTDAEVWVCLLDAKGAAVIDGQILAAGADEGPFRSRSFTVAFGNGAVELEVDGRPAAVEETPNPIGYTISSGGELRELAESERPTCT